MNKDFTQGSVPRTLFLFALPILLTSLLQASMQLINGLWVGNLLGSDAFAAVTVATTIMMVVLAFVLGVNNATLTIFAQLRSKGDQSEIDAYLSAFVIILGSLSLLIGLVGFVFAEPLLRLLRTPDAILASAKIYLQINFAATFLVIGYNFIGTVLRAFGDSKTPLYFVIVAICLTAVLGPWFMAGLNLGIAGAAYAIVLAQALTFIYSVLFLARRYRGHSLTLRVPKPAEIKIILELGIPSGAQMNVIYAGMSVILALVNSLGAHAVAGFGAAQRLDNIILLPALALGTAVNAMAAQNIGVERWQRVGLIAKVGVLYNIAIMLSIATLLFLWAEPLVRLFVQDQDSLAFGTTYLRTIAFFYPFIGLNFILNGIVRGAGAMFQILILNIISLWILRVPLTYWATSIYGESGVALGIGISFSISCLFSIAYYYWGGWRTKKLFT